MILFMVYLNTRLPNIFTEFKFETTHVNTCNAYKYIYSIIPHNIITWLSWFHGDIPYIAFNTHNWKYLLTCKWKWQSLFVTGGEGKCIE